MRSEIGTIHSPIAQGRRVACYLAFAAALASGTAAADTVRHRAIPAPLLGRWAPSTDECKDDKSVVILTANRYAGPEGDCTVDWVVETAGTRGPAYSAHLVCDRGSGEKTIMNRILLPKGTDEVLVGTGFDSLKSYRRCPASDK
jgi:hypothetical protein